MNSSPNDRHLTSVYFKSDAVFLIINILFGLSNGYINNICLMAAPKMLEDPLMQSVSASHTAFSIVAGLLAGSATSRLFVKLL